MNRRAVMLGVMIVLGLGVLLVSVFMVAGQEISTTITVRQLVDEINAGNVTALEFESDNEVTATLRDSDTRHVVTNFDSSEGQERDRLIALGAEPAALDQIEFEFVRPDHDFPAIAVFVVLIPLAVIGKVLWRRRNRDPRKRKPKLKRKNEWA